MPCKPSRSSVAASSAVGIHIGQQFLAKRGGLGAHLVVQQIAGWRQHDALDPAVGGRGLANDQPSLHQSVHHGHHGRAFNTQTIGQLGLRQRRASLGGDRDGHPAGLADTQVFEPAIQGLAPGSGGVMQRAAEAFIKIGHSKGSNR